MLFFRVLVLFLLLAVMVSFVLYAMTGQARFKRFGLKVLLGTLVAAFGFFAVLVVQQL